MRKQISPAHQSALKILLGAFTVYAGLSATWEGVNGGPLRIFQQLGTILLALVLGNLTGKVLHIQGSLNRLGQYAKGKISGAPPGNPRRFQDGFVTCSILFCAAPLAILGSLEEGLTGNYKPLAVKAAMDGLATMAFVTLFGWSVMLSVIPLMAWQGTLALLAQMAQPWLANRALLDPLNATAGLLV